jgi:cytochrome oxidase Cu insertion factor (SCO1/SenC/PrrC family)
MTPQQKYAMQFFLSIDPATDDWEEALAAVVNIDNVDWSIITEDEEDVLPVVWEAFESYPSSVVASMIEEMADELTERFGHQDESSVQNKRVTNIVSPKEQTVLVFGMGEGGQDFIYRMTSINEAKKLIELAARELDMHMEIVTLSGYMSAEAVTADMRELLGMAD